MKRIGIGLAGRCFGGRAFDENNAASNQTDLTGANREGKNMDGKTIRNIFQKISTSGRRGR